MKKVYKLLNHNEVFKTKEELEEFCSRYNIYNYDIEEANVYIHYNITYNMIDYYTFELDDITTIETLVSMSDKIYTYCNKFHITFNSLDELNDTEIVNKVIDILKDSNYYILNNDINIIYLPYEN